MKIDTSQDQLIQDFSKLSSWEEKYQKIIQIGKELPLLDEKYKTEDLKVRGCQSQVWLRATRDKNGLIIFEADSDALIVKGLIAILLKIYSGQTADYILATQPDFIGLLKLDSHLSPSRTNGLYAMIKQIKYYALAYKAQ